MSGITVLTGNPSLEKSLFEDHGKASVVRRVRAPERRGASGSAFMALAIAMTCATPVALSMAPL